MVDGRSDLRSNSDSDRSFRSIPRVRSLSAVLIPQISMIRQDRLYFSSGDNLENRVKLMVPPPPTYCSSLTLLTGSAVVHAPPAIRFLGGIKYVTLDSTVAHAFQTAIGRGLCLVHSLGGTDAGEPTSGIGCGG